MTDKSLKTYVGEDRLPVNDLTEYVNWPESRFMTMAYNGDSSASEIVLRDENATFGPWTDSPITIGARNEVEVLHGSNFLYRGRLVERTWARGEQKAYNAREVRAEAEDVNVELRGLLVDQWVRPVETDVARVTALKTAYLSGAQRVGANLSTTYVSASNSQSLPAKTYTQTDPLGVMNDVAFQTHKQFFVTIDKQLFYDGYDSTAYASPFSITDDPAELKANPTTTLSIIPDSGPLFNINGRQFISRLRVIYGSGPTDYVDTGPIGGLESAKAYWTETVYAPDNITNATEAANLGATILTERSQDGRTFTLSVGHANGGPLTEAQIGSIKPGHLIRIKARVLPLFLANGQPNHAYYTARIVTLQWHMPLPGQYFATLKLEHPERTYGIGTKPGPRPPGAATAASCALDPSDMTAISTPNGDFENGTGSSWTSAVVVAGDPGGVGGLWMSSSTGVGAGGWRYDGWTALTFTAGQTYVIRVYSNPTGTLKFGHVEGGGTDHVTVTATYDGVYCIEWTPSADRTNVTFHRDRPASGSITSDNLQLYTGGSGDVPENVGSASAPGTDSGVYSPIGHVHGHGTHTADYHTNYVQENVLTTAGDVPYATGASTWTRLPIGGSNLHLRSDGTKPVWSPESGLTNPMTTLGDIIKGGASGTPERLAIGSSNTILKSTGTTPEWNNTARLSYLDLDEHVPTNPPNPVANTIRLYGSNSKGYYKNSAGTVVELGGSGGGGGSPLTVQDEGTPLATDATTLNFVGAGVAATGAGATKTITIPGGGSSSANPYAQADIPPASPDAQNEEFDTAFTVTPTFVSSSGTATSAALMGEALADDSGPVTNPPYNVDSDIQSNFVMQALNGGKLYAHWPFAPTSATEWCVVAKMRLFNPTNILTSECRLIFGVSAAAPTTASGEAANSIGGELRTINQGFNTASIRPGTRTNDFAQPTNAPFYVAIAGVVDNSISVYVSHDGMTWRRKERLATGTSPAGGLVTKVWVYLHDVSGTGQGPIAMVDFIRYNDTDSNFFTLMG